MSLNKIQKDVDQWTSKFTPQYWQPLEMLASLVEETGEVSRELNHMFGAKKKKSTEQKGDLAAELIDIVFAVTCIANSLNIDLEKEWQKNLDEKLYKRDINRFQPKDNLIKSETN